MDYCLFGCRENCLEETYCRNDDNGVKKICLSLSCFILVSSVEHWKLYGTDLYAFTPVWLARKSALYARPQRKLGEPKFSNIQLVSLC